MAQNDPRLDGLNTNPPQTLDYQRLVEATDITVRWDTEGAGSRVEAGKLFDLAAADEKAMQRADETAGQWSAQPSALDVVKQFIHVWSEGLMHGIVFVEQRAAIALLGKLPDHNLINATSSIIGGQWTHDDRAKQWARRIDPESMTHVALVRSVQAVQVLKLDQPSAERLRAAQAAQWADGFLMGFLFAELGGHRED